MFHPLTTWSIGPLTLSVELLFLLLALMTGFFAVSRYLKWKGTEQQEEIMDKMTIAVIAGVAVFKFWPFVLQPSLLSDLRNIIYFSGGPWAVPAAMAAAFLIIIIYFFRKQWPADIWEALLGGVLISLIFFNIFVRQYGAVSPFNTGFSLEGVTVHPVNFYYAWLYFLSFLGALVFFKKEAVTGKSVYFIISIVAVYLLMMPFHV
ncbi:hypothetical protein K8O68_19100 [Salipaludibacillus sp. CUR1]|uniref:hypothetical protein n=1 Tax=Salipaludibacillus sp. CUR1 TaxID=2820003 RepID=UPI001E462AA5|nr:hypothetical protein [Salipaludibacillus sp. CUR1]MCE7794492.1 hypothetical protein [Salipaludibacillus sp. CUR1]